MFNLGQFKKTKQKKAIQWSFSILCSCMSHTIRFDVSPHKVELLCPRVFLSEAGVMLVPEGRTVDGFERHFGVNYLGHFLLTWLLLDTLKDCGKCGSFSRVLSVSSSAHRVGEIGPSDPHIWYIHACTSAFTRGPVAFHEATVVYASSAAA